MSEESNTKDTYPLKLLKDFIKMPGVLDSLNM